MLWWRNITYSHIYLSFIQMSFSLHMSLHVAFYRVTFYVGCLAAVLKTQVRFQRDFSPKHFTLTLLQTGMTFFFPVNDFWVYQAPERTTKNKTKPVLEHSKHCSCALFHVFIYIIWEKHWYFSEFSLLPLLSNQKWCHGEPVFNVNGANVTFSNPFKLWQRVISLNKDFKFQSVPHAKLMYDFQRFGISL